MIPRLKKYNPAFLSRDELVNSFVVRLTDLDLILETIRHNTGEANQHILIIGPRGSGKTSLVLRTAAAINMDTQLASRWHPIVFAEESYKIFSPGEFWLEALVRLGEETDSSRWQKTAAALSTEADEVRLRERALAQLMDFADEQGKRLLLVVENLNMILGQQIVHDDYAWVLRHTLINEPRIMLLGTATSRFTEIDHAGKALYDQFKLHELRPLDTSDCCVLWQAVTGNELAATRARPIEILTGGNPRLLAIIANFAATSSFRELMQDLTQLVDDHTEYFKSHLDSLPPLERKVFVALADLWDPLTARQVAEAARVEVNTASSLLKRLISRGAVEVFEQRGRRKWYQVAERLYNIYHLMRRRGGSASRVRAVVNFMVHFYDREQLVDHLGPGKFWEMPDLSPDLRESRACQEWGELYPGAETRIEEAVRQNPEVWFNYLVLAYLQGTMGKWQTALENVSHYVQHAEISPEALGLITEFFIEAAAAGHAAEARQVIQQSKWAAHLEPLMAGLSLILGEEPTIAQEILEVGRDVAKKIEERKQQRITESDR